MTISLPADQFLTFDEAVAAAHAHPGDEFIGLQFIYKNNYVGTYRIRAAAPAPEQVRISLEGGRLYCNVREDESYGLETVPAGAKSLVYLSKRHLPGMDPGICAEQVLYAVFKDELPDPSALWTLKEQERFAREAARLVAKHWRKGRARA